MICVSVREKRCCVIRIYVVLMVEMFYSFERCFTLFDLPLHSFTSVGVNRSGKVCCTCTSIYFASVPEYKSEPGIAHGKKKRKFLGGSGGMLPWKILKFLKSRLKSVQSEAFWRQI